MATLSLPSCRVPAAKGISRDRLTALLGDVWNRQIALIVAPAGSGKTTLLAHFARSAAAPVAWYLAEPDDGDEETLIAHLEASCTAAFGPSLEGGWAHVQDAVRDLETWGGERGLIVVDDAHSIAETPAEAALERLADYLPPNVRLVVASRRPPAWNLSRLRVSGALLEIVAENLRFRSWEVEQLFRDFYGEPLPAADLAQLARRTEGWAAGLQLFYLATTGKSPAMRSQVLASMATRWRMAGEYLARNVLGDLPDELRQFLVGTSVLGRLNGSLCDELLGRVGSARVLEQLEQRQIFTVALDGGTNYRYHEALLSYLEVILVEEVGEAEAKRRYLSAARLLERDGLEAEALQAYGRAGDWVAIERLLGTGHAGSSARPGGWPSGCRPPSSPTTPGSWWPRPAAASPMATSPARWRPTPGPRRPSGRPRARTWPGGSGPPYSSGCRRNRCPARSGSTSSAGRPSNRRLPSPPPPAGCPAQPVGWPKRSGAPWKDAGAMPPGSCSPAARAATPAPCSARWPRGFGCWDCLDRAWPRHPSWPSASISSSRCRCPWLAFMVRRLLARRKDGRAQAVDAGALGPWATAVVSMIEGIDDATGPGPAPSAPGVLGQAAASFDRLGAPVVATWCLAWQAVALARGGCAHRRRALCRRRWAGPRRRGSRSARPRLPGHGRRRRGVGAGPPERGGGHRIGMVRGPGSLRAARTNRAPSLPLVPPGRNRHGSNRAVAATDHPALLRRLLAVHRRPHDRRHQHQTQGQGRALRGGHGGRPARPPGDDRRGRLAGHGDQSVPPQPASRPLGHPPPPSARWSDQDGRRPGPRRRRLPSGPARARRRATWSRSNSRWHPPAGRSGAARR